MDQEEQKLIRAEGIARFTTNLKHIRNSRGVTPEELDEKCKLPPGLIRTVEAGEIIVTMGVVETIADALECTLADLFRRLKR